MRYNQFSKRHIGPNAQEQQEMLASIGVSSMEELMNDIIPDGILSQEPLKVGESLSEAEYLAHIREVAQKNKLYKTYIGLGYHTSITPSVIQRNILENPGWYTAYTPYQAEIAQGRLEALLNFQTAICDLTGMDLANASLLDESTAASEAMLMLFAARSRSKKKANANKFYVSDEVLPQTMAVLETRALPFEIELVIGEVEDCDIDDSFFGGIFQYPTTTGSIEDYRSYCDLFHSLDAQVVFAADIMALVLLENPATIGADVVVGSTQRFGIPLGYGGPHAAYFATSEKYKRQIPGRIIGVSKDVEGNQALRMALQTREQHIKRDKATSNICTSQVLLAVMAGMYAVYHGPEGLKAIASDIHQKAVSLSQNIEKMGYSQVNNHFFDTLYIDLQEELAEVINHLALEAGMNFLYIDPTTIAISINEGTTLQDLNDIVMVLAAAKKKDAVIITELSNEMAIPADLARKSEILTHEVFHKYHSETEMMRYIKKLERKDLSLNHSMIALGSCTMKLNAASEMIPLNESAFAGIHPFAPKDQAEGYEFIINELDEYLSDITGFAKMSFQPNSGAQGEYAGLLCIKSYHEAQGNHERNIALIPASAHGTNPASASMCGMKIVVVKSNDDGTIDIQDLREKAEKHAEKLSCLMVTYPSTHGTYEEGIKDITDIIHQNGGLVYMDGANMNAQVGLTSPGIIGADVCHLNLHKTFAIPHGGGGPGMGPIGVVEKLVPHLPDHPITTIDPERIHLNTVSAAPYGSAFILLISYGYIKMLGTNGLTDSTKVAMLNANYIKSQLEKHYEILYTGNKGTVAHEMILECRDFKEESGVTSTDIAKRLMDYGYHAPTVSFPVAGTLMIEPTESESKAELDRFISAMVSIRKEVQEIVDGKYPKDNNPLINAPHTLNLLTANDWSLDYSRQQAAYPLPYLHENKFWPSVRRVDEAFGDRNLMCACPSIEEYETIE
ncbi:MAG: aminomethyl-transferring glycine dehydrogenase [Flavobacteriales bacterium]|jgi:glycine dehydrogenase|nr:aminomethyl-transferring glycine dehydrogenase [Flavobacteriales bacterium]